MFQKMGKRSHIVCDRGAAPEYRFMPGTKHVGADPEDLRPPYSAVFTCDSGSWSRLERIAEALPRDRMTVVNIDHHASNDRFGDINWIDPSFSSSGEMIYELVKASGIPGDKNIATCIYVALTTDTGRFSFSNTTVESHLNAAELLQYGIQPARITQWLYRQKTMNHLKLLGEVARRIRVTDDGRMGWVVLTRKIMRDCGCIPSDTQEFIDLVKSIKGVEVAILLRETDEPNKIKVSWRTDAGIDGIAIASKWGGGGHPRASGATVRGRIKGAEREVISHTRSYLNHKTNSS